MNFNGKLFSLLLFALFACEKSIDIPGPLYRKQAVLTGLLQPDSVVSVRLTYTAPINTTSEYEPITNAAVTLLDNGSPATTLVHAGGGIYKSMLKPRPGHLYQLRAEIPNYGQLAAEDVLPISPSAQLNIDKTAKGNPNNNPDFTINWQPQAIQYNYWLSFYVSRAEWKLPDECYVPTNPPLPASSCRPIDILRRNQNFILTNSPYLDGFNSIYDSLTGQYIYSAFARFDPNKVLGKSVELTFTTYNQLADTINSDKGEVNIIDLYAVGPNYDKFLKSVIRSRMNQVTDSDDVLNNPFAEVTPIYSNVTGGLGIFGAVSTKRFTY